MVGCREPIRGWELLTLIAVLVAAMALRVWRLDSVPPGLTHDEANNVADATAVLQGARPFYFPVAQGKEPLYPYSAGLIMALLGPTPLALRITSVIWGMLLVFLAFVWARKNYGGFVALLTVAGLATSFWGISTSRLGLRAMTLPVLLTATAIALPISESRPSHRVPALIGGICLGLTFYTYLAARVMPALFILFAFYLLLTDRARWRKVWSHWLMILLVAAVVAAPLFVYLQRHPAASIRIGQLDRPLRALLSGNPGPLLRTLISSLEIFSFRGDGFIPYNIPGRPLLDPVLSALFYAGLLITVWRWRQPANAFALLWLLVGFFPALATGRDAANLRAIAAQPVTFLFPALALRELWDACRSQPRGVRLAVVGAVGSLAFGVAAFLAIRDYFVRWPNRQDVRVHYHADLRAIAETVEGWSADLPVGVSTLYPGEYHDPRVVQAFVSGGDPSLRWFDGRHALVLPSSSVARLVLPAVPQLDQTLWDLIRPHATLSERVELRPGDFNPTFDVYRWASGDTREDLLAMMMPPAEPDRLPVGVGDVLDFQGYQLQGWTGEGGSELQLLSLWDIASSLPDDRDAVLFVQLLDSEDRVIAQRDELGAPSWNWCRGESFVQLHRLSVPADAATGEYHLIAGAYTTPDRVDAVLAGHEPDPSTPRLAIRRDNGDSSDAITLVTLEIP